LIILFEKALRIESNSIESIISQNFSYFNLSLNLNDETNYPSSNLRFWEIGIDNGGIEFHLFIEKINTLYNGSAVLIFISQFIFYSIFIPFLSMRFKQRNYLNSLKIFDHPQLLLEVCDYLLIQRFKCNEDSLEE